MIGCLRDEAAHDSKDSCGVVNMRFIVPQAAKIMLGAAAEKRVALSGTMYEVLLMPYT
jgi:hypothetical protein